MVLRIYTAKSLSYILAFAIIRLCEGIHYDAPLAIKMKEMDMEYGERLTSLEEGELNPLSRSRNTNKSGENLGGYRHVNSYTGVKLKGHDTPRHLPSTRCTTAMPLPKLNPWFRPKNENDENDISFNYEDSEKMKYRAPDLGTTPKFYVDDE